jgi:hypothetical protein
VSLKGETGVTVCKETHNVATRRNWKLGLKNGSSASTVAFGILSDELDVGDPVSGAESFKEFNASTSIIEEDPPMKLRVHINDLAPTERAK